MKDPNVVDMVKTDSSQKQLNTIVYRITHKNKSRQVTAKIGYPEFKKTGGTYHGVYPQIIVEQARLCSLYISNFKNLITTVNYKF